MTSEPSFNAQSAESSPQEARIEALLQQSAREFARVVYGLNDHASGRNGTMAADDVTRTIQAGTPVTRERAEQRARSYLPTVGNEYCPRCWIFNGIKSPLHYRAGSESRPETAVCRVCSAEYLGAQT